MGKREKGTPKYMANKNKARGLQKLKYYCQMCKKQCRDFNGFKCHTTSESHHRQMLMFTENANQFIDRFSQEFLHGYVNLLKRQFGTRRVPANQVYQEYISDKGHIHMNATKWLTLTAFVKWLGSTGKCIVDETEKVPYQYLGVKMTMEHGYAKTFSNINDGVNIALQNESNEDIDVIFNPGDSLLIDLVRIVILIYMTNHHPVSKIQ
ncbi:DNA/RNA-binding protein KIN17-like isoform X2 [Monomorium pharaonis]|uniref:DNA/RNA-binding protein KIN17-like isoform X2 n=1 Tax=Monomorium pharaonis TaxID=307658 RepID=UPI00174708A7|nr:DNA/RNA-binding protein KIN17-like isoform X2 [Monomorium pharaonis]XP_036146461.1 DNA/RNA-binding protein KIN17-like isoform X2 [Monomorium pharaonis]